MTNRQKAIEWWNNLDFEEQIRIKNKYLGTWFSISMISWFSIEIFYEYFLNGKIDE